MRKEKDKENSSSNLNCKETRGCPKTFFSLKNDMESESMEDASKYITNFL